MLLAEVRRITPRYWQRCGAETLQEPCWRDIGTYHFFLLHKAMSSLLLRPTSCSLFYKQVVRIRAILCHVPEPPQACCCYYTGDGGEGCEAGKRIRRCAGIWGKVSRESHKRCSVGLQGRLCEISTVPRVMIVVVPHARSAALQAARPMVVLLVARVARIGAAARLPAVVFILGRASRTLRACCGRRKHLWSCRIRRR